MGNHKRLTIIEIVLILAIVAILVVWLFPRFLKTLESDSATTGMLKLPAIFASDFVRPNKPAEHIFLPINILPYRLRDPGHPAADPLGKKFHNMKPGS